MTSINETVDSLLVKATSAAKSEDALRFTQAALNAAHVKHALADLQKQSK